MLCRRNPHACGPAKVAVSVVEEVRKERMDGKPVTVTKMTVKAISDGANLVQVPDTVQYAIVILEGEEIMPSPGWRHCSGAGSHPERGDKGLEVCFGLIPEPDEAASAERELDPTFSFFGL
jgi:hypothetical protein